MTITEAEVEISTPTGPMRSIVFRPAEEARKFPGLVLFSEIFQITGPIRRTGAYLAGHGYVVVVPEIYHELEPMGTVLPYDQAGARCRETRDKVTQGTFVLRRRRARGARLPEVA